MAARIVSAIRNRPRLLFRVPLVEAVLIEIEPVVVGEGVHHSGHLAVEPERVEPQVARVEGTFRGVPMKGEKVWRRECRGAALPNKAPRVKRCQRRQHLQTIRRGGHPFEADVERPRHRSHPTANVGAMSRPKAGQVGVPRVAGQADDRAHT